MNIIIFIIFLVIDLIVVLSVRASYGGKDKYREGMLFGVHIPKDALSHPEVEALTASYRKKWNLFQRCNVAAAVAICFLGFVQFAVFVAVWLVWILQYMAVTMHLVYGSHRELYRIKVKNGWIQENSRRIIRVDTAVSACSHKMAVSWKWHLLPAAVTLFCFLFIVLSNTEIWTGDLSFFILLILGLLEILTFIVTHLMINRRPNGVYSKNSETNYLTNMLTKRVWSAGLTAASFAAALSAVYITVRTIQSGWLMEIDLFIYILLQLVMGAAVTIPAVGVRKRRAEILDADEETLETDDDEYWKKGWYSNPDDAHLFVRDRMNDMNFTFNMARPAARVMVTAAAVLTIAVILFVGVLLIRFESADVTFTKENDTITVEAAGYDCEFTTDEIESVMLIERLPEDRFLRTNGGATDRYDIGYYRGRKTGKCMMFLYTGYTPILQIELEDMTIFANSKEPGEAESWYRQLQMKK